MAPTKPNKEDNEEDKKPPNTHSTAAKSNKAIPIKARVTCSKKQTMDSVTTYNFVTPENGAPTKCNDPLVAIEQKVGLPKKNQKSTERRMYDTRLHRKMGVKILSQKDCKQTSTYCDVSDLPSIQAELSSEPSNKKETSEINRAIQDLEQACKTEQAATWAIYRAIRTVGSTQPDTNIIL